MCETFPLGAGFFPDSQGDHVPSFPSSPWKNSSVSQEKLAAFTSPKSSSFRAGPPTFSPGGFRPGAFKPVFNPSSDVVVLCSVQPELPTKVTPDRQETEDEPELVSNGTSIDESEIMELDPTISIDFLVQPEIEISPEVVPSTSPPQKTHSSEDESNSGSWNSFGSGPTNQMVGSYPLVIQKECSFFPSLPYSPWFLSVRHLFGRIRTRFKPNLSHLLGVHLLGGCPKGVGSSNAKTPRVRRPEGLVQPKIRASSEKLRYCCKCSSNKTFAQTNTVCGLRWVCKSCGHWLDTCCSRR